jgi:hypothetical protein
MGSAPWNSYYCCRRYYYYYYYYRDCVTVFENRLVRRILETNREEVAGRWRALRNEELRNLYSSSDIIRVIKNQGS